MNKTFTVFELNIFVCIADTTKYCQGENIKFLFKPVIPSGIIIKALSAFISLSATHSGYCHSLE